MEIMANPPLPTIADLLSSKHSKKSSVVLSTVQGMSAEH